MDLNSAVLNAEAYNENDEIVEISVRKDENILQADVVFGEPVPNPFSQSTSLRFFLKERSDVQYTISDLNGKLIYQKKATKKDKIH